ncbi:MAG: hypothetical protein HYY62_04465 [Deltaproteobacteria bacterium]|nr:hypothetical protein [Deltaproteobacteria bacterium]
MKKWLWYGMVWVGLGIGVSCASKSQVYKKPDFHFQNQKIFIVPFENMTNTPKAGHIVAKLIDAEFRIQGNRYVEFMEDGEKETLSETKALEKAKSHKAQFLLIGTVTEFRYRKGFSENPAIGFTAKLIATDSKEIVWTITLSDSSEPFVTSALTANELTQKMARQIVESMR